MGGDVYSWRRDNLLGLLAAHPSKRAFADRVGTAPAYISQLTAPPDSKRYRPMGTDLARQIEARLGLRYGSMDEEGAHTGATKSVVDLAERRPVFAFVPLVSWVTAGGWSDVDDPYPVDVAEDWIPCAMKVGKRAFALTIQGDSMEPEFPTGYQIIVDPDREAVHGSHVVVRLDEQNVATFKQLVIDGGRRFLKPLNPRYPMLELNEAATICGVVVYCGKPY